MSSDRTKLTNQQDGGEAVLEAFRNLHVDYVISSPGSEWPPIWEALARQNATGLKGPTYMDCGHETLAVGVAVGYTQVTGRMQAVLLHAGSGLLQGAMALQGARSHEVPMLVMSGESLSYGELADFDPGNQWYRNLGVVGGPQRLIDSVVKWANQVPSPETLYQSVVRAGEMAKRLPTGPVYLNAPVETLMHGWTPRKKIRDTPEPPKTQALPEDVERVASLIAKAKSPVIFTESAGRTPGAMTALIELTELMGIPVLEGRAASYANFPKSHPLHLGTDIAAVHKETDLALLIESRVPWYPPGNTPPNATIVSVSENPLKDHMVYQTMEAEVYLEGDLEQSLRLLTAALKKAGATPAQNAERRKRWEGEHGKLMARRKATQDKAKQGDSISTALLCRTLNDTLPKDTIFLDETIVHSPIIRDLLEWDEPHSFFRIPSGLGQGLSIALGAKLAARERPVTMLIGDGSFLYNPVLPCLTFSKDQKLPILIVIFNNNKYEIMRRTHVSWYPEGVSASEKLHYGVHIENPDYAELAKWTGGVGIHVDKPASLSDAIAKAYACVQSGRTAIVNVMLNE
ncbi:thiamine pyrophosphate-dependent enzyme [Rhodoplanes sp. Z2-YC6860]|uniref:thiamine pyrophosphate-dependent enzyme n=1 Tax=Rhodoplanes sp. Z2-YC6860 TaxID=674703 RepID=UPI00078BA0BA|nr:thiamine pyrophosphate-dependent enzyme [Rhodoplanes sp. Z2-YC6860]AMN42081.1 thiamine pyrophosphate enzyme, C- TPP binding domain-containing protein [Rhodoplanes sp. Z2-YC6860]